MTAKRLPLIALLALSCGGKVPPHLQVDPAGTAAAPSARAPASATEAVAQLIGQDPFLRRALRGPEGWWDQAGDQAGALRAWQASSTEPRALAALQQSYPATLAVPLSQGDRLIALEAVLRQTAAGREEALALAWGLQARPLVPRAPDSRGDMEWLHSRSALPEDTFYAAERAVLLGWLDGPQLPLGPVDAALQDGRHDRWIDSPAGALLRARARGLRDAEAGARGRSLLEQATRLELAHAAADRDSEQAAWAAETERLRDDLGLEPGSDVAAHLLRTARTSLTRDAGEPASTGLALVALQAERLRDTCPDRPCAGLDRVWGLRRAAAWGPEATAQGGLWRLIEAKNALDRFLVGHDRRGVIPLLDTLAELASGEFARPTDIALVRRPVVDAAFALSFTRAAGGPEGTQAADVEAVLRRLVLERADAIEGLDPETAQVVARIRRRARPEQP